MCGFWPSENRWHGVYFLNLLPWKWKKKSCANFVLCSEQMACNSVCLLGLKCVLFNYLGCVWYYPKP